MVYLKFVFFTTLLLINFKISFEKYYTFKVKRKKSETNFDNHKPKENELSYLFKDNNIINEDFANLLEKTEEDLIGTLDGIKSQKEIIENYRNVQYFGDIYLGSNNSRHSVIFDTGSNILWVPSIDCKSCRINSNKFDYEKSKTFINTNRKKIINYAIGSVEGTISKDSISLDKFDKIMDYNFLLVDKESNLNNTKADGVLGIGINNEGDKHNSLIELMYDQKIINEPIITVILSNIEENNRIYFGNIIDYDLKSNNDSKFKARIAAKNNYYDFLKRSKFSFCHVKSNIAYWACEITELNYYTNENNKDNKKNVKNSFDKEVITKTAVFDTGTSYLIIPFNDLKNIVKKFMLFAINQKCSLKEYGQLVCMCGSNKDFPDLEFSIGNGKIKLKSQELIDFYEDEVYQCHFQIMTTLDKNFNIWILGDTLLRSLIIEFNMNERKISYASKEELLNINIDELSSNNNTIMRNFLYLFILLFVIFLGFIIWRFFFKPMVDEDREILKINDSSINNTTSNKVNILDNENDIFVDTNDRNTNLIYDNDIVRKESR